MANDLTGDFDVVAQFATAAANKVLASMHRSERFPHALSLHVDDTVNPGKVRPAVVASVDVFGDVTVNHERLSQPPSLQVDPQSSLLASVLDPIINAQVVGSFQPPPPPSLLKGRAQLQVFPPTLEVPDDTGTRLRVRMRIMARYFPEPGTSPLAEFIHGDLVITAGFAQVASQVGRVLAIDVQADSASINFTPIFSSRPLSGPDIAGIDLLIRNAFKTSFLPSNATLPANIDHIQFKTLAGSPNALAILLNLLGGSGNAASAHSIFLGAADDFAFGAGVDFVRATFQPTLDNILSQTIDPVTFDIDALVHTFQVTYTVTLTSASIDLQPGKIVLTILGHAHTSTSWSPDFDFTVLQDFGLSVDGATANLVVGDLRFGTSSTIVNLFKDAAMPSLTALRDKAIAQSHALTMVRKRLSAEENLGGFLRSLLDPPRRERAVQPAVGFDLRYTSVDIRPAGIVLHGALSVPDWPPAYVEFEQIPTTTDPISATVAHGPDYSAIKTWIPGGAIERFEWTVFGTNQPLDVETHQFVMLAPPPLVVSSTAVARSVVAVTGYTPMCLTIHGTRIASSGLGMAPVSASACNINLFPIVSTLAGAQDVAPIMAVTRAGADGLVNVVGHTAAKIDTTGVGSPNLIVHFADDKSAAALDVLPAALRESGRKDAATAIVAVLSPDRLSKTRYLADLSYAHDDRGSWERLFDVTGAKRPCTLIVSPAHKVLWRHDGPLDQRVLVEALRKHLGARKDVTAAVPRSRIRIGQPPPNILFEHTPGHEITLRKLGGRPAALVFWRSGSAASIDTVRSLQTSNSQRVVLAVNDGETPEVAKRAANSHKIENLVTDADRTISQAYGVTVWPTVVFVDALGVATRAHAGRYLVADAADSRK